jgi:ferredoxin-NADP reductase
VAVYDTRLLQRKTVAEGTMAFSFARPPAFAFEAGQNMLVTLVDPPQTDAQGPSRTFTIASAPHEPDLTIATRMRDSAFKRVLKGAPAGLAARIEGPGGMMTLHEDVARPAVFLAGGIGITPFLSMARHAAQARLPHQIYLFYSNRRPEDAAFLAELHSLERANPRYRLIATMVEPQKSAQPWSGQTGVINRELVEKHIADPSSAVFYFAGPPGMAMAMQKMLEGMGIADEDIRSEEFYGY